MSECKRQCGGGGARPPAWRTLLLAVTLTALAGCKAGGQSGGLAEDDGGCTGSCAETSGAFLSAGEVQRVLDQAMQEAARRNQPATVAVVDRVGNVLALARRGAARDVQVQAERLQPPGSGNVVRAASLGVGGGLEGALVPDALAAIAKAVTAAYLSSEGNAFTTRTANQIVQEHFNPGEVNQIAGPLYGVQFSQLPCSDLNTRGVGVGAGPRRSPLGLSADPGGLPLYRAGTPVGGVGVVVDGFYGMDADIDDASANDRDQLDPALNNFRNLDEIVALAAGTGFEPPDNRRADRITVDGRTLRYADARPGDLQSNPAAAPAFGASGAALVSDATSPRYFDATAGILAGRVFGESASGYAPADDNLVPNGPGLRALDAFVLVDGAGAARFPPRAGSRLSLPQVRALLREGLELANRTRAQIRRPVGSQARLTVSVVDVDGTVLGVARSRDGPVFGTDVSLQKARTAAFLSRPDARALLLAADAGPPAPSPALFDYVRELDAVMAPGPSGLQPLADGTAFSARAVGNLARPFFPDGLLARLHGPLSVDYASAWSPFNVGLQLDFVLRANGLSEADGCRLPGAPLGGALANGLQIFPGGVPVYVDGRLAGGLGVSGDGVDQDDMTAFLAVHNAALEAGGGLGNAPSARRSDAVADRFTVRDRAGNPVGTTNLRYVQCPRAPFLDSTEAEPCAGK